MGVVVIKGRPRAEGPRDARPAAGATAARGVVAMKRGWEKPRTDSQGLAVCGPLGDERRPVGAILRGSMILNGYAVLAVFLALIQLTLGVIVLRLGVVALKRRAAPAPGTEAAADSRLALLVLLSGVLVGVAALAWPLLYLLLDSYVPQWAGVMCIQGVTRIGTGSLGAAGWLPTLIDVLEVTKPLLVFATGAWLVLHLVDRKTRTSPLHGRVLALVVVAGCLAAIDAAAQLAYVGIPKKEQFLAQGCCTVGPGAVSSTAGEPTSPWVPVTFYVFLVAVLAAAWRADVAARRGLAETRTRTAILLLGVLASIPVGVAFLHDIASPAFLGKPGHRCVYCLISSSPLGVAAVSLYLVGILATAWACVARALGAHEETRPFLSAPTSALTRAGILGYAAAGLIATARWITA